MVNLSYPSDFPKQLSPLRQGRMELMVDLLYFMEVVHEDPDNNLVQWHYLNAHTFKNLYDIYGIPREQAEIVIDDLATNGLVVINGGWFLELTQKGLELGEQIYMHENPEFEIERESLRSPIQSANL